MNILLVEPKTRTSFPPLGLMKIAMYHQLKGDKVTFVVGENKNLAREFWDKIYITSVFTYDFESLIKSVHCYSENLANFKNIIIGGISASLLPSEVEARTGISPHVGLLSEVDRFLVDLSETDYRFNYLSDCGPNIDSLPPDYQILEGHQKYKKFLENNFILFSTKGCPNSCKFCAVDKLEPEFKSYLPISPRINYLREKYGDRAGLLFLDNNIAASPEYFRIIDEIKDLGFKKGDKFTYCRNGRTIYKQRRVDFNQGVDLRLMTINKMSKMAEIAIDPLRLAFDHIHLSNQYYDKAVMAIDCGIMSLSNYMLYNYHDKPSDLYKRFMVNIDILERYPDAKIFSFPMRYSPIFNCDRNYVGKFWTKREIRAIQLILNATHGIVSHKRSFFFHAFGENIDHFHRILLYPYQYIINREHYEKIDNRIDQWEAAYRCLSKNELNEFLLIVKNGIVSEIPFTNNCKINNILLHYIDENSRIVGRDDFDGDFQHAATS